MGVVVCPLHLCAGQVRAAAVGWAWEWHWPLPAGRGGGVGPGLHLGRAAVLGVGATVNSGVATTHHTASLPNATAHSPSPTPCWEDPRAVPGPSPQQQPIVRWVANWLEGCTQRVVVDGSFSTWRDMGSGVPQGSVLGPAPFNMFISDFEQGAFHPRIQFADSTKMWEEAHMLEGRDRLQLDLDRLQGWADENKMGFNTDKCGVLHLGRKNQQQTYRLGNSLLISTEAEKDLGVIRDSKMNMGRQCGDAVRKANRTLSCIHRCISSRSKEVILTLFATLVRPQLEYCVQLWALHFRRDVDSIKRVQRRLTCMIRGQQHRPYEERLLRVLNLFSLHKRRLRGDLVAICKLAKGDQEAMGESQFPQALLGVTRNNSHKLTNSRFRRHLNIRRRYFTVRAARIWNQLPREVVLAPTLRVFKRRLDNHLAGVV
uniref:Reverse transcriptase domain-containing protein n=1 Tax=Crocodylus porosus TaxID=8502 RepID=A0A7M4FYQ6_CROPO